MTHQDDWEYPYDLFIKTIAHKMRYTNDAKLAEYQLTSPQGLLLEIIDRGIRMGKEISRKNMGEVMQLKGPTITNLLNGLERKGYIIRSTKAGDARAFHIEITSEGKKLLSEMEQVFEETEQQLLKGMTEEEKKLFLDLLVKAWKNIDERSGNF
ncbi:MarR family transcriptional regulator [Paenibacillus doosanensis]|uniref:MarR family winged helix-turn-helix transcriptional regulator n=1 Tax=Paenibacillus doosanensis TaxID=1229154 RepID=UPI0021804232|nr:MarR family transcriptional regulator [Paenibacillus doosanensis]MCS7462784.1 MarR family transcriptional regulator [Paenibacillus doosanensis]